ncbi:MAG: DUF1549 and DUF1553 domain-containing protein [Pirellulales bacterium]
MRTRFLAIVATLITAGGVAARAARADDAPSASAPAPEERPITPAERDHWAYRPLGNFQPPVVSGPRFAAHPVDRFIAAAQSAAGVQPLPRAGKATLARRLWFDLTGLPPTPQELQAFLADDSPDAYEQLVDRLLASPAYGERWAQHWLDLARFAETDGFEHDFERPNAWRYRDWVIDALNRDLPYDEFVRLQIAGDELRPGDRDAAIATGFLLCGPDMPDLNLQDERRHVVLNEMTATVGSAFLAMQFGCAACHDHKFDPIRQHDFYRLRAFFESTDIFRDHPVPTPEELAIRAAAEKARPPAEQQQDERRAALEEQGQRLFREKNPDEVPSPKQILAELTPEERKEHAALLRELHGKRVLPKLSQGRIVRDGSIHAAHFYLRGDFRQPGPVVECGYPRVLEDAASAATAAAQSTRQPRTALAAWLTAPEQPLTARVIVNRLWQWHFGVGLSATASDFGLMGAPPSHPELLDWLARHFVADGWSLKRMHRLLVTSETYQLAAAPFDVAWSAEEVAAAGTTWKASVARDPENRLLWHRRRARLDGEAIRDAMLAASGRLSLRRGGPGIRPPLAPEVTETLLKDQWKVSGDDEDHRRRSIYLFVRRNLRYPLFDVFDRPDTMASCALRHDSTTATQSLTQLNSAFSLDCARRLAGAVLADAVLPGARLAGETSADAARADATPAVDGAIGPAAIERAYLRVLSRSASDDEVRAGLSFIDQQSAALRAGGRAADQLAQPEPTHSAGDPFSRAALVDLCLALLNSNEFLYVE